MSQEANPKDHLEKFYSNEDGKWFAEIPLWVPGFRGQFAYGDVELSSGDSDVDFSRIITDSGLEFYFAGRFSYQNNKIWIQLDAFSGQVSNEFRYYSPARNSETELVNIQIQGSVPRLVAGYSIWNYQNENDFRIDLIPYIGVGHVNIKLESQIFDTNQIFVSKANWYEPLIGLYLPLYYKRFKFEFQGDYGGIEEKRSWILRSNLRFKLSKLIDIQLGLSTIRLDYEGTVDSEELQSAIRLLGPTAGVGFQF